MEDIDKLLTLYGEDGTASLITPRSLMEQGMALEDIHDAVRHSERFRHIHDIAQQAREAGMSEAVIAEAIDVYRRRPRGPNLIKYDTVINSAMPRYNIWGVDEKVKRGF